jgi:hypothetical protein
MLGPAHENELRIKAHSNAINWDSKDHGRRRRGEC